MSNNYEQNNQNKYNNSYDESENSKNSQNKQNSQNQNKNQSNNREQSILKREITDLGYDITEVADGRVTFFGDEDALCRANIFLRTAERILIKIGSFHAETFEELFQGTKNLPWEEYIPKDGKFWLAKAASVKSKLFSPSDIQSIMKKAMVERLKAQYEISWFPEDGENFPVRVFLMKDEVTVGLDSTGESLHERGYRKL